MVYRCLNLDVEDVEMYRPGGYHPIHLNDIVNGRYRIIHKLGHGGFSTIWLARYEDQYFALKILIADASDREVTLIQSLQADTNQTSRLLQDSFVITGPNGTHQCLVLEVAGPCLRKLMGKLSKSLIRSAQKQIAQELAHLHSRGICHGDLTDSNVLFELSDFKLWTEAQIYEYLGVPRTAPLYLHDGSRPGNCAPSVVVESIQYTNIDERWFSGSIRIIDFGEAFHADRPPDILNTQASFLASEVLFGQKPSTASDIWALGCLMFELEASKPLFPVFFGAPEEAVTRIVQTIGALPKEWHHLYYDDTIGAQLRAVENHWWFDIHKERRYALESQISSIEPKLTRDETTNFISLLRGALEFDTSQRLSAQEIEMHEWCNRIRCLQYHFSLQIARFWEKPLVALEAAYAGLALHNLGGLMFMSSTVYSLNAITSELRQKTTN